MGFSAGGHLVAALSTNFETRTYDAVDEADKVSCRPDFTLLIYPAYLTAKSEHGPVLAPELKVTANTPPSFLIQAEDDGVGVENTLVYYAALRTAKVPAEAHLYPVGGHGYGLAVHGQTDHRLAPFGRAVAAIAGSFEQVSASGAH